jgi:hypothetical protein
MPDTEQRFQLVAELFEVVEHNLLRCRKRRHRRKLLRQMLIIIEELDQFVLNDLSWLGPHLASAAPNKRPFLVKAAHQ